MKNLLVYVISKDNIWTTSDNPSFLSLSLEKYIKAQIASLIALTQFIWAAIVAYPVFGEIPPLAFYPGSALIVLGIVWAVLNKE